MKILIVDDSELLQSRLKEMIEQYDRQIDVVSALNCQSALTQFANYSPDTVILDINLPDGSGIDLLRVFKSQNPSVRIIIFTNYQESDFRLLCLYFGADLFLNKSNMLYMLNSIKGISKVS